jgi:hypothetical protein
VIYKLLERKCPAQVDTTAPPLQGVYTLLQGFRQQSAACC